jgi:hypothetical protein
MRSGSVSPPCHSPILVESRAGASATRHTANSFLARPTSIQGKRADRAYPHALWGDGIRWLRTPGLCMRSRRRVAPIRHDALLTSRSQKTALMAAA